METMTPSLLRDVVHQPWNDPGFLGFEETIRVVQSIGHHSLQEFTIMKRIPYIRARGEDAAVRMGDKDDVSPSYVIAVTYGDQSIHA